MLFVVTACGSTPTKTDWVENPSSVYSDAQYLSAVGQGSDLEQASTRAQANLAKMFSVSIYEKQIDSSSFNSAQGQTNTSVSRHVSAEAQQELKGAKVVESRKAEDGSTYALAVLDKNIASQNFRSQIRNADKQVSERVSYASNSASNVFSALSALKQAHSIQLKRENLNRNLVVASGKGIPSSTTSADIEALFRNATSSLKFSVQAEPAALANKLSASSESLGIAIAKDSPLVLKGKLDTGEVFEQGGWYWLRATLNLAVEEHGKITRKQSKALKVSAKQKDTLAARMQAEVDKQLDDELLGLLMTEE